MMKQLPNGFLHNHVIYKCKCMTTISQCACPEEDDKEVVVFDDKCPGKHPDPNKIRKKANIAKSAII